MSGILIKDSISILKHMFSDINLNQLIEALISYNGNICTIIDIIFEEKMNMSKNRQSPKVIESPEYFRSIFKDKYEELYPQSKGKICRLCLRDKFPIISVYHVGCRHLEQEQLCDFCLSIKDPKCITCEKNKFFSQNLRSFKWEEDGNEIYL